MYRRLPRLIAGFAVATLAGISLALAQASERADLDIVGFSPDGAFFAFLQSGKQDGSNFPFADLIVVESGKDGTARDTPVRFVLQDANGTPEAALMRLEADTWPLVRQVNVGLRGRVLWRHDPPGPDNVERRAVVDLPKIGPATIRLTQTPITGAEGCTAPDRTPLALRIDLFDGNNAPVKRLTGERTGQDRPDCPIAYGIVDVRILEVAKPGNGQGTTTTLAVTVAVFRPGLEGNSRRFMAVVAPLD